MEAKHFVRVTLCAVLAVLFLSAQAKTWQEGSGNDKYYYYECDTVIDGIAYRLDNENFKASVTFFTRKNHVTTEFHPIGDNYTCNFEHNYGDLQYRGDVVIPETVEFEGRSYTVTSIDTHAFDGCKEITNLQIPQSVYYDYAYWHDDAKEPHIYYGGMIPWYSEYTYGRLRLSIDVGDGDDENYYKDPFPWLLEKPAGTVVYHGDEVALIVAQEWYESPWYGSYTRRDGRKTVNVDVVQIKEGAKTLSHRAAYKLSASHVVLPPSLEQVKSTALLQSNIGDLTMDNVKSIGDSAFHLAQLGSVSLASVEEIGNCAFLQAKVDGIVMDNVKTLGDSAFYKVQLENISLPKVEDIGKSVFRESSLKHISFNPSLKAIGEYAFSDCKQLADVQLPDSLTTLGNYAFNGCTSLTNVVFPNSLTTISSAAFFGCTNLTNVTFPNSLTAIGSGAFYECRSLTDIVIPYSVSRLGYMAFYRCTSLKNVTIPSTIKQIGYQIFDGAGACEHLTLVGNDSLSDEYQIYSYPPGSYLSQIYHLKPKEISIGSGIIAVGKFYAPAKVVNCYAETPPECDVYTFRDYNGELHVPSGAIAAYFTAPIWENFTNLNADLTDKVTLEETEAQMLKGEELQLTASTIPEAAVLAWGTTDPAVAVVDSSGKVTATGVGECDIFASLADNLAVYAWCHIDAHIPATITLPTEELTACLNTIVTLTPMFDPEPTEIVAASSDPAVALVRIVDAPNGAAHAPVAGTCNVQVLGVKEGVASITVASSDGLSIPATLAVTVIDHFPEGDVNCDRTVNGADVTALYNALLGENPGPAGMPAIYTTHLDGTPVLDGDVNGDGVVSGADVTALYNLLLN